MADLHLVRRGLNRAGWLNVVGQLRGNDIDVMILRQGQDACSTHGRGISLTDTGLPVFLYLILAGFLYRPTVYIPILNVALRLFKMDMIMFALNLVSMIHMFEPNRHGVQKGYWCVDKTFG